MSSRSGVITNSPRMTQTVIERIAHPSVSLAVELETVTLAEHGETLIGVVRGSVIHHDQLEIGIALRVDAGNRLVQILRDIETGANDGNERSHFFLPSPGSGTRHKPITWLSAGRKPCHAARPHIRGAFKRRDTKKNRPDHRNRQVARPGARRTENRKQWRKCALSAPTKPRQSGTTTQRRRKDRTKEGPAAFLGELHDLANTRNHGTAFSPAPQRDARTLARKTKPLERQAFQGLCSYVMAER